MTEVLGLTVDDQTRCVHYATTLDVIAIRFACCREFYPCHLCHEETADHPAARWSRADRAERAVLCGVCGARLAIAEYEHLDACSSCGSTFNPGCKLHWTLYFDA